VELAPSIVEQVLNYIRSTITRGIDRMKTNKEPVPVILCGGGSILMDLKQSFEGVTQVCITFFENALIGFFTVTDDSSVSF
jgi:hypothetical protein